jgi:hypothetical protein
MDPKALLEAAIRIATQAHAGQRDKEGLPSHHPSSVALLDLPNWFQVGRLGLPLRGNRGFNGVAGRCVVRRPRDRTWRSP